jgi:AcrR family transcriptional regulator
MDKINLTQRQLKAQETKKNLYNSAIELFKLNGYYNVTVTDITKKAGTAKGSFYTHFKSKDEIIIEEFKKFDKYYQEIFNKINKTNSYEILYEFLINLLEYFMNKVGYDMLFIIYDTQLSYEKEKTFIIDESRPLYEIINKIIEKGQNEKVFRDDVSSADLTKMIIRTIRGTFYEWCLNDGKFDLLDDGAKFYEVFLTSLQKK